MIDNYNTEHDYPITYVQSNTPLTNPVADFVMTVDTQSTGNYDFKLKANLTGGLTQSPASSLGLNVIIADCNEPYLTVTKQPVDNVSIGARSKGNWTYTITNPTTDLSFCPVLKNEIVQVQ